MVPVLGRVASGMWQVARAELQQDLDSPQCSDGSAQWFCGESGRRAGPRRWRVGRRDMLRVNRHTRHMPVSVPIEFQPMPVPHRATGAACRPRFRRTDGIQPFVTKMSQ